MSKGNYFLFEPILSIMDAKTWGLETRELLVVNGMSDPQAFSIGSLERDS